MEAPIIHQFLKWTMLAAGGSGVESNSDEETPEQAEAQILKRKPKVDLRARRERLLQQDRAWKQQIPILADAYLCWKNTGPPPPLTEQAEHPFLVQCIDFFRISRLSQRLWDDPAAVREFLNARVMTTLINPGFATFSKVVGPLYVNDEGMEGEVFIAFSAAHRLMLTFICVVLMTWFNYCLYWSPKFLECMDERRRMASNTPFQSGQIRQPIIHLTKAFLLREILSSPDSRITGYGLPDSVLLDGSRGSLSSKEPVLPFLVLLSTALSSSTAPKTRLYRPTHKTSSLLLHMAALAVSFEPSSTGLYNQTTKWSGFNNEMVRI
ncbi:hypothetical protein BDZ89DRAFT_1182471 [Hymenopellis radicata]|nr:hypothetical protein BDZ89DRAFT_1182471 [Hymenopellis radicata]